MSVDILNTRPIQEPLPQQHDEVTAGFVGLPEAEAVNETSLILYRNPLLLDVGIRSFMDSGCSKGVVGQLPGQYNRTIPMELVGQQEMFLTKPIENENFARHLETVRARILHAGRRGSLRTTGGEDLSYVLSGRQDVDSALAAIDGARNPGRDMMLMTMYAAAFESGAYISATCKSFQALLRVLGMTIDLPEGLELQELGFAHRAEDPKNRFTYSEVASVISDQEIAQPLHISRAYCNHHEGFRLGDPNWQAILQETGWRPYYVSTFDGKVTEKSVVESVVLLGPNGEILGMGKQYHDEKDDSEDGEKSREWDKQALVSHWQRAMSEVV